MLENFFTATKRLFGLHVFSSSSSDLLPFVWAEQSPPAGVYAVGAIG